MVPFLESLPLKGQVHGQAQRSQSVFQARSVFQSNLSRMEEY